MIILLFLITKNWSVIRVDYVILLTGNLEIVGEFHSKKGIKSVEALWFIKDFA